jgi:ABC-type Na+ efflux pump permease subunit
MTVLPVVAREMRSLARRNQTYAIRLGLAGGALGVLGWLLIGSATAVSTAAQGKTVFAILSGMAFTYALFAGIHITSDSLSEEKREGTLGLLFLTDLRSHDIVLGKMAATALSGAFALFSVVPVIALAVFLGGVSGTQIAMLALALLGTLAFSLSLGVFVSSISTNERKAMFATTVLVLLILVGPLLPGHFGLVLPGHLGIVLPNLPALSPLYSLLSVFGATAFGLDTGFFWWSLLWLSLAALASLWAAARILPRFVHELPSRRTQKWRNLAERWALGTAEERKQHRARLLDRNAFAWLAARERNKPRYAWLILGIFALFYLWVYVQFPDMVFELPVSLTVLFLIHFSFKLWTASEVCSRLIQDRRSGALELLLSTPLSVKDIARGQSLALARIFRWPVAVLIAAEIALLWGTLWYLPRTTTEPQVILCFAIMASTLLLDLWAIKWVGMWLSLRGKSIERALLGTTTRIMTLPWAIFAMVMPLFLGARLLTGHSPNSEHIFAIWWGISIAVALAFALPARARFLRQFREIATQRFDAPVEKIAPEIKQLAGQIALPRSRNPFKRRLAWIGLLALLIALPVVRREYWERKVQAELFRIEKEGLPAGMQTLGRYYPPLPVSQNALAIVSAAGAINLGPFGNRFVISQTYGVSGAAPMIEHTRKMIEQTLALNGPQLDALRRAVQLPSGYLQPTLEPFWMPRADLCSYAVLAWMSAVVEIEKHNRQGAVDGVIALLKLAAVVRAQPVPQAQFVAGFALDKSRSALERLLHSGLAGPEDLERIDEQLKKTDAPVLERSLIVRRAFVATRLASGTSDSMAPPNPAFAAIGTVMTGIGNHARGTWKLLQAYRTALALVSEPAPKRLDEVRRLDQNARQYLSSVPSYLWPSYELASVFDNDAAFTARVRLMQAGLMAERFRLVNGRLPATLPADLSSLEPTPIDPFTGQPIRFLRENNQLKLYSLHSNRTDEQGREHNDLAFSLWDR